jgi:CelD/BcsL family acetyltransferase involved in cellulose biosynthesis
VALVIEQLSTLDELAPLESVWNRLLSESGTDTVFLTFEWVTSFLRWVAVDSKPMVLVVEDGGDVVGIAPLMLTTTDGAGRQIRRVEFAGVPNSDYSDFIVGRDCDREAVVRALFRHLQSTRSVWDEVLLTEMPEASPTVDVCRQLFAKPWSAGIVREGAECPTLILEGHEDEIIENLEHKKYIGKRDLQKSVAYIGTQGKLTFQHAASLDDAERVLPHLFRLHRQRWADTPTPSKFENPNYERFYGELLTRLWSTQRVAVTSMELDSQPMAVSYAFPYGTAWTNHNWVYDFEYSKFSPGSLLIQFMITDAIKNGFREFDFTRGAEAYKDRFKNAVKRNTDVFVYGDRRVQARDVSRATLARAKGKARRTAERLRR